MSNETKAPSGERFEIGLNDPDFFELLRACLYHIRIATERGLSQSDAVMEAAEDVLKRVKLYSGTGELSLGPADPAPGNLNATNAEYFALGLTLGAHFQRIGLSFYLKASGKELN